MTIEKSIVNLLIYHKIMKKLFILIIGIFAFNLLFANRITDTLEVSYDKEVIILFDSKIKEHIISVDVNNPDVLFEAHSNKGVLQAAIPFKKNYNLFIETETGNYLFILKYNENPKEYLFQYTTSQSLYKKNYDQTETDSKELKTGEVVVDEKSLGKNVKSYAKKCYENNERNMNGVGTFFKRTIFELYSIYVDEENIYFVLDVKNTSEIDYNIDFVKFVVRNKKKSLKASSIQEETVPTLYIYEENKHLVTGLTNERLVYVFKKFTIHPTKLLHVELWEKGGDRKVEFILNSSELLKAKRIN